MDADDHANVGFGCLGGLAEHRRAAQQEVLAREVERAHRRLGEPEHEDEEELYEIIVFNEVDYTAPQWEAVSEEAQDLITSLLLELLNMRDDGEPSVVQDRAPFDPLWSCDMFHFFCHMFYRERAFEDMYCFALRRCAHSSDMISKARALIPTSSKRPACTAPSSPPAR